jgi:hypothetical protein
MGQIFLKILRRKLSGKKYFITERATSLAGGEGGEGRGNEIRI